MKDNPSSSVLWHAQLDHPAIIAPQVTEKSIIVVSLGLGTMGRVGYIDAFHKSTGRHLWSHHSGLAGGVLSTPIAADGRLLFGTGQGEARCLNLESGEVVWSESLNEEIYAPPAIGYGQAIFVTTRGRIASFSLETGVLRWSFKAKHSIYAAPVIEADQIIAASWDGHVYSLDPDGKPIWNVDLSPAHPTTFNLDGHALVMADSYARHVRMFAIAGDRSQWQLAENWRFATGDDLNVYLDRAGDDVIIWVRGTDFITCLNGNTGDIVWAVQPSTALLKPVVDGERLLVVSRDGQIISYDCQTGTAQWHLPTALAYASNPAVSDGVVYLGGSNRRIYAIAVE